MRTLTLTLCLWAASLPAQTALTVEQAVRLGLKNNYDIQIARNNAVIAENGTVLGTANLLPTLEAAGSYDLSTSDLKTNNPFRPGGTSDSRTGGAQLVFNWTLFDGFRMFADKRRFAKLAKLGDAQARSVIENKVVEILRAYFDLVQQKQLLDVNQEAAAVSRARLEQERVRHDLGGASSTDLLNAQVAFNQDRAAVLNQELQVTIAGKNLNILLGRDPQAPLEVVREIDVPPLEADLLELTALALERNSDLIAARQNHTVVQQDLKLARAAFLPRLSLSGRLGFTDQTSTTSTTNPAFPPRLTNQTVDGSVTLNLSFNLFNGLRDRVAMQNAQLQIRNAELSLENLRNQIAGLVQEKYATFQKRLELLELEQQNAVAAEQQLALQQERYQVGSSTSLEFRDAQVNLTRAKTNLIAARHLARITRLELDQLTGRLVLE